MFPFCFISFCCFVLFRLVLLFRFVSSCFVSFRLSVCFCLRRLGRLLAAAQRSDWKVFTQTDGGGALWGFLAAALGEAVPGSSRCEESDRDQNQLWLGKCFFVTIRTDWLFKWSWVLISFCFLAWTGFLSAEWIKSENILHTDTWRCVHQGQRSGLTSMQAECRTHRRRFGFRRVI